MLGQTNAANVPRMASVTRSSSSVKPLGLSSRPTAAALSDSSQESSGGVAVWLSGMDASHNSIADRRNRHRVPAFSASCSPAIAAPYVDKV
jgi:hypothetical protein